MKKTDEKKQPKAEEPKAEEMPKLLRDEQVQHLITLLSILVHRAGGTLKVGNIKEYAGKIILLTMEPDPENDGAILKTVCEEKTAQQ